MIKTLPIEEKLFAFTAGSTWQEFVYESSYASLLHRRYKEIRLPAQNQAFCTEYPDILHLLVIVAEDSPDTIMVLPILQHLVQCSSRLDLRILRDDDDFSLLGGLLEDESMRDELTDPDLPLLFIFDEEWQIQGTWGPRPQAAEAYLDEWLERHPEYETLSENEEAQDEFADLIDQLTHEMRVWYNSELNQQCGMELCTLFDSFQEDNDE